MYITHCNSKIYNITGKFTGKIRSSKAFIKLKLIQKLGENSLHQS